MTDAAIRETVTRSQHTIHNPDDPRHFMRVKPAGRYVTVSRKGRVLAEGADAFRVIEAGNDMYDPLIYFPRRALKADLAPCAKEKTWCPLKGHAVYFDLPADAGEDTVEEIAWSYEDTLDFAAEIKDLVAFYPDKVTIEERPLDA